MNGETGEELQGEFLLDVILQGKIRGIVVEEGIDLSIGVGKGELQIDTVDSGRSK